MNYDEPSPLSMEGRKSLEQSLREQFMDLNKPHDPEEYSLALNRLKSVMDGTLFDAAENENGIRAVSANLDHDNVIAQQLDYQLARQELLLSKMNLLRKTKYPRAIALSSHPTIARNAVKVDDEVVNLSSAEHMRIDLDVTPIIIFADEPLSSSQLSLIIKEDEAYVSHIDYPVPYEELPITEGDKPEHVGNRKQHKATFHELQGFTALLETAQF